jgi:rhamnopyranosyl-N-acetylglucosaminyl-diphospho-decaprenol beta-1,3/1,4-galactofuranosyltransferase
MNGENMNEENKKETVCAVVVTYNRKNLLLECLEAIRRQTRPVDGIYIIDNASDDGTPELLKEKGYIPELPPFNISEPYEIEHKISNLVDGNHINVFYVRMHKNTGGAGGFYEGVKRGYERGYDCLWLMDDDTIATTEALNKLLEKIYIQNINIGFACSKVLWTDGKPHLMNIPGVKQIVNGVPFNIYEDKNVLLVEGASFVSLLISRDIVKSFGLPIKEFFIWADDVEYTLRIAKNGFVGLYVKDSIVIHKTKTNYSANEIYDWRFYYNVRNWLWIHKIHNRRKYISSLLKNIFRTFSLPLKVWRLNIKACADSFFTNPKIDFVDK